MGSLPFCYACCSLFLKQDYIDLVFNCSLFAKKGAVTKPIEELMRYPSLCFALGREMGIGGAMNTDLELSYRFLIAAKKGYEIELAKGNDV